MGSAIAPPLVVWITVGYGWRAAFVVTGLMGLVWLAAWLVFYDPPHKNRWISAREYAALAPQLPPPAETKPAERINFTNVSSISKRWGVTHGFRSPFGGVGYLIGGWLSGHLISRGWTLPSARK